MLDRCRNPKSAAYPNYGGRGIRARDRWQGYDGFINFLADMGPCPPGCSIDRKDNNGDYTSENCRWATDQQQARNTRHNVFVTFNSKTPCIAAWAEETGIKPYTLYARLGWLHWPVELALTLPTGARKVKRKPNGQIQPHGAVAVSTKRG
jgi:hypothetical protein